MDRPRAGEGLEIIAMSGDEQFAALERVARTMNYVNFNNQIKNRQLFIFHD
jgi:hypothetical protein